LFTAETIAKIEEFVPRGPRFDQVSLNKESDYEALAVKIVNEKLKHAVSGLGSLSL